MAIAAGGGALHEAIALSLGISRETLRKWYVEELTEAAARKRVEVLQSLYLAAKKGNVSAAKAYLSIEPQFELPPEAAGVGAADRPPAKPAAPVKPAAPLGKKDQAQADAVTAAVGTDWDNLLRGPAHPSIQ